MYIQPSTNIRLLKNVPLDNAYEHTIFFADKDSQYNYFSGLQKYNLTDYSYQRVNKGTSRVGIKADSIYDCNYMMFQNTAYGNKWFYAFITSVEYVNNECSEITFELDVMQTWFFDCEPEYCFIEREHSLSDRIGEHLEPEICATGEYVFNNYEPITLMTDMVVCLAIVDVDGEDSQGTLYDGVYGAAQLFVYNSTDVQSINAKISEYTQSPDSIIAMYMIPKKLIGEIPSNHKLSYGSSGTKITLTLDGVSSNDTLDGYKPKNKKMYTYPYNFYHVDNASGGELSLRYEFFESGKPVLEISGTVTQPVVAILRPCSYKGVANYDSLGGYTTLNTECLQLSNYPMCSWNVDAYKAWVAQNSVPIGLSLFSTVAQTSVPSTITTPETSAIGQITNVMSQYYRASIAADINKGHFNNGGGNVANHKQQFYGGRCSVNAEFARMIDDFFTMYGYTSRKLKKPNRNSRPHWNYVKTIGATVTGSVPADDMRKICSIYDNGITFWKNGTEVGHYELDNTV